MLHTIILLQSNRDCFSRFVDVFLASRGPSFRTILSSLQLVLCRVVAVKCQFSGPLGVSGTENRVSLKLRLAASAVLHHYITIKLSLLFVFFDVFLASSGSSFRTYFIFTAAGVVPCGRR